MRRFVAAVAVAVAAISGSHAQQVEQSQNESASLWFVELSSRPTADGTSEAALEREEARFHAAAAAAGVIYREERHFRRLWNGMTVRASEANLAKVRALAGVRAVYPVVNVELNQDGPVNLPELVTALAQTGADIAQSELGLTGAGIRVAVMDTGVDYDHPDLGGCFGAGCRVEKGWDLVGDAYNSSSPTSVRAPDPFPDDCGGHGTHVAGIVGANGTLVGVAPGVTFHAYRVFGCTGTTSADVMLEAMERALADGSDVLNMSIGSAYQWPQYPTAQGADRLVKQGVVVVASIGNNGANGLYSSSAPGVGSNVIGVASFDNTHANLAAISISPDGRLAGYNPATAAPPPPFSGSSPMSRTGTSVSAADSCNGATAPAPGSLTGTVALVRRGTCGFFEKALNAQAAGAAGVVLYNNAAGRISPTVAGAVAITIPVVMINAADGVEINNRLAAGPVTMTWTDELVSEPQTTAGLISGFSSYGLPPDLSLKPDIGAPGGNVRSTIPLEQGAYGPNSGTSMSSPHVAGAVALLLEARPTIPSGDVLSLLQTSADPRPWFGNPALGFLDNVHRQGGGMLNIIDAIEQGAIVRPSKIALGEIESGTVTRRVNLEIYASEFGQDNWSSKAGVTYTLGHEPALSTGPNTFTVSFLSAFGGATFSSPTVNLSGATGRASFDVTFTPPSNASARLFGGYITLTPNNGGAVLRVPYAGYNGDYQLIPAVVPTANNFPWLARLTGTTFTNQPEGAIFTLVGEDQPNILLHLDHAVEKLTLNVINATTGKEIGPALDDRFITRNSGPTTFFALVWDGTVNGNPLPDGTYQIKLSVLKALGQRNNAAHQEHWTSPNITIARPAPTTP